MPDSKRRAPRAAVFSVPAVSHTQRLRAVIAGLVERGFETHVFADAQFARGIEATGARLFDLSERFPIDAADDESSPRPCRFVTFAGHYAEPLLRELERLQPSLVVYDTFAVIGYVLARAIGVPHVNVCAGHNTTADDVESILANHPHVAVSDRCHDAVRVLRDEWGFEDASPFSYLGTMSSHLNLYCEPPEFLPEEDRLRFEPVEFFGSLPPEGELAALARRDGAPPFGDDRATHRVYVSFGTIIWRYWAEAALDAIRTIAAVCSETPDTRAIVGLGGAGVSEPARRELCGPHVDVLDYVPQWRVLQDATAFVTHHGLNSTHEAIYNGVPMISYPFFWDQPDMARRCQELGLALPLVDGIRATPAAANVRAAFEELANRRQTVAARLAEAREWELGVLAGRDAVLDRVVELAA